MTSRERQQVNRAPIRTQPQAQREFDFPRSRVPVPDCGSVIIMRLEDLVRVAGVDPMSFRESGSMTAASWEDSVVAWLKGSSRPGMPEGGVHRAPDGRALRVTTDAILRACPIRDAASLRSRQTRVGALMLNRLGWSKERRRIFGGQEYFFCAPAGWD